MPAGRGAGRRRGALDSPDPFRYNGLVSERADDRPYALVLGGGGTKGAYQVGAWRAFRELGVRFHAIVGASVGGLNGALIAQDAYDEAVELWRTVSIDKIVAVPPALAKSEVARPASNRFATFAELNRFILRNHGLDTGPLRELIHRSIDEARVRASGIDFGITTYELSNLKPLSIFLDEIPAGLLADYLLASASFPAFRATEIQGKRFADGGLFDNVPYRMARSRGYRRIIVVDVSGLGFNRKPDVTGTETIYLKNSIEIGTIFEMDREFIDRFMELGYLDAMRLFGRYEGTRYFIEPDPETKAELGRLLFAGRGGGPPSDAGSTSLSAPLTVSEARTHLPRDMREQRDLVLALVECAALALEIERVRPYTLVGLLAEMRAALRRVRAEELTLEPRGLRSLLRLMRRALRSSDQSRSGLSKPPLAYDLALERVASPRRRRLAQGALRGIHPYLLPGRAFLAILERYARDLPAAASDS